jgi:type VI secretion system secreted protein VgrG
MSKEKLFSFNTPEFSDYNLEVVSFKGSEEIGELYSYEIDLVSKKDDIDFDKMLQTEVSLQLHNKDADDIYIHGVLAQFEAHQKIDEHIHYKAYLVPKLWWLSISQNQQIFLDKKITDILETVLKEAKLTSDDYELRLQGTYEKNEYVCQYKESRYDFLRRWMEKEGIYFYFEQDENGCKVIVTDVKDKHKKLPKMDKLPYRPSSGLQDFKQQAVSSIVYRSNNTVKSVRMKNNYNYEKPSVKIDSTTHSSKDDNTQTYLFGNNLGSQKEAQTLTDINTQKYLCLAKEMSGESNIISLTPGCVYTLSDYFRSDLNSDYLMIRMESEGSQRGFLSAGFTEAGDDSSYYQNSFMMIPSETQFRMQISTQWPQIGGMISATIDASGSGDTAEIDKDGRYKVIMPFDVSGKKDAKASANIRMAQPSAGEKQGMHFPLHKGTEVLISFIDGDPDQPVIMGAVPNKESPSSVVDKNET